MFGICNHMEQLRTLLRCSIRLLQDSFGMQLLACMHMISSMQTYLIEAHLYKREAGVVAGAVVQGRSSLVEGAMEEVEVCANQWECQAALSPQEDICFQSKLVLVWLGGRRLLRQSKSFSFVLFIIMFDQKTSFIYHFRTYYLECSIKRIQAIIETPYEQRLGYSFYDESSLKCQTNFKFILISIQYLLFYLRRNKQIITLIGEAYHFDQRFLIDSFSSPSFWITQLWIA